MTHFAEGADSRHPLQLSLYMPSLKNKLASTLHKFGVTANIATLTGLGLAFGAGYLIYLGEFFWAAAALLLSGGLDLMDGEIARISGTAQKPFGGILDSTLDRYGDAALMGGALFYFVSMRFLTMAAISLVALVGFFAVSYVRARAECVMPKCRVGFWERGERLVFLSIALFLQNLECAVIVLALGTQWTASQRLWDAAKEGRGSSRPKPSRTSVVYLVKCAFLVGILAFWRPTF